MSENNISPFTNAPLKKLLEVKDYLVSSEIFGLYHDPEWDMLITQPQPKNIAKYYESENYQPHKNSQESRFDRLYDYIRHHLYRYKYRLIQKFHPQAHSVLDYGTATGEFLRFMQEKTFSVSGVEPNKDAREIANDKLENSVRVSIDELNDNYDVITLWHVLEHIAEPEELIQKLKEKLNPGGIMLIAVPNFKSYDAAYYAQYWASYDVPRHLWHFSTLSIKKLFEKHQLQVVAQKPLYFDSFYISLLSEQYKNGKKRWIPAIYRGLLSNLQAWKTGEYSSLIYVITAQ